MDDNSHKTECGVNADIRVTMETNSDCFDEKSVKPLSENVSEETGTSPEEVGEILNNIIHPSLDVAGEDSALDFAIDSQNKLDIGIKLSENMDVLDYIRTGEEAGVEKAADRTEVDVSLPERKALVTSEVSSAEKLHASSDGGDSNTDKKRGPGSCEDYNSNEIINPSELLITETDRTELGGETYKEDPVEQGEEVNIKWPDNEDCHDEEVVTDSLAGGDTVAQKPLLKDIQPLLLQTGGTTFDRPIVDCFNITECSSQISISVAETGKSALEMGSQLSTSIAETSKSALEMGSLDMQEEGTARDFIWEEYLEEMGALAVPPTSFKHVEKSLESGVKAGMKVEVGNKSSVGTYWVATVIMTCGPLLRLRYDGYDDDRSADFWCDMSTSEVHRIGWCGQNSKVLQPPAEIRSKYSDWSQYLVQSLSGASTVPTYLLNGSIGTTPVDQIQEGMPLEVTHELDPTTVWVARVQQNVGGRLLLRWEGCEEENLDFWEFYLSLRLHSAGWGKSRDLMYKPPIEIQFERASSTSSLSSASTTSLSTAPAHSKKTCDSMLESIFREAESCNVPPDLFSDWSEIEPHEFKVGMKLEWLRSRECDGADNVAVSPASVRQVVNDRFFIIEMVDCRPESAKKSICAVCHSGSAYIFPVGWAERHGVPVLPPQGWDQEKSYDWPTYMQENHAVPAAEQLFTYVLSNDHGFETDMKLEFADTNHPHNVCAATVTRIVDRLLWIRIDSNADSPATYVVDVESRDLFPVGWCESNSYPLQPPGLVMNTKTCKKSEKTKAEEPINISSLSSSVVTTMPSEKRTSQDSLALNGNGEGRNKSWCPIIYFNHKCFSGPYLSKGRIAELPRSVGPGPINLVLKDVLTMFINVAYKSSRVLRELQLNGKPSPNMYQLLLKAKYKMKSYRATVEICKTTDQVEDFCRQICLKLECCPYLFGPHHVNGVCPDNCSVLTKTKYTYYFGKRKKVGRPLSNKTGGPLGAAERRGPGRRKRKHWRLLQKEKQTAEDPHSNGDGQNNRGLNERAMANGNDKTSNSGESLASENNNLDGEVKIEPPARHRSGDRHAGDALLHHKARGRKRKYRSLIPPRSEMVTRGAKLPKYTFEKRTHQKIILRDPTLSKAKTPPPVGVRPRGRPPLKRSPQPPITPSLDSLQHKDETLTLDSNPLHWSVMEVAEFIKKTDCSHLAILIKEQEIDGQALLLLNLPTVQEHLELKLGPAVKLCHQVERVKLAFFEQYGNN